MAFMKSEILTFCSLKSKLYCEYCTKLTHKVWLLLLIDSFEKCEYDKRVFRDTKHQNFGYRKLLNSEIQYFSVGGKNENRLLE